MSAGDDNVPMITQRIAPMGFERRDVGMAGMGESGPNVKVIAPPWWEYVLLDIGAWAYVTGWITTSAFYGAGELESHGLTQQSSSLAVLGYISVKAFIPAAILAMKDIGSWLYKRRQAHGLGV